jgi:hypothetical protein
MKISKEKLQQKASITGFKMEHLEKVYILMDLLNDIATFPQLKGKFVLFKRRYRSLPVIF